MYNKQTIKNDIITKCIEKITKLNQHTYFIELFLEVCLYARGKFEPLPPYMSSTVAIINPTMFPFRRNGEEKSTT